VVAVLEKEEGRGSRQLDREASVALSVGDRHSEIAPRDYDGRGITQWAFLLIQE
jgi:hypothetical protein